VSVWRAALAAAIVLGLALRLWGLDAHGLWFDEALEVERALQPVGAAVVARHIDQDPPLYPVLLHAWLLAGRSDAWARLPGALLGTVAVALIAVWSGRAGTRAQALIAALLLAVAPVAVHYAGEVNQYALVPVLAIGLALALERVIAGVGRFRWLVYTTLCAMALATHYGLAFLVGAQFLALAWEARRRAELRLGLGTHLLALVALTAVLLLAGLGRNLGVAHLQSRFGGTDLAREAAYVADVGWRDVLVFLIVPWSGGAGLHIARAAAALAALGAAAAWQRGGPSRRTVTVALLLPLALSYLASGLGWYPLGGRYALLVAPALVVAVAGGVDSLRRLRLPGAASDVLAGGATLCLAVALLAFLPQRDDANPLMAVPREDVRAVLRGLGGRLGPGHALYVYHGARPAVAKYLADGSLPDGTPALVGRPFDGSTVAAEVDLLETMAEDSGECWLLFSHVIPGDHELLLDRLVMATQFRWRLADVVEADGAMAYHLLASARAPSRAVPAERALSAPESLPRSR
jgi:mannosyltransferase